MKRYVALDVFRGLTVALMIVVNTPGNWQEIYAPFKHAEWHGFTVTDLVFPSFLFVVGNALSLSMGKLRQLSHSEFAQKVLKRTLIMFVIGVLLNAFPFVRYEQGTYLLKDIRLWGVLQRIALCYGIAAYIIRYCSSITTVAITILILLLYWWILYRFGDLPDPYSLRGNAIGKLDRLYLPAENMYKHYGFPFDPLGLLSTVPAIVNVIAGYFAGRFIQQPKQRISVLFFSGLAFVISGIIWDNVFPINKALWTSSYVIYTIGFDLLLLVVLLFIIDIRSFNKWTYFFEVFGRNPLFIYIMAWVIIVLMDLVRLDGQSLKSIIYNRAFTNWLPAKDASLLFAIVYMLMMWIIGYVMDRKRWYVKV